MLSLIADHFAGRIKAGVMLCFVGIRGSQMRKYTFAIFLALSAGRVMAGQPEVVQMSPDTYMIAKTSKAGIFGNPAKMKIAIIKQANDFAASKGKVAVPLSSREDPLAPGHFASFEYQFRLVDPSSPAANSGAHLEPRADVVVDVNSAPSGPAPVAPASQSDLYTQLMKLDDLRKRGILTEEEFQAQKRKLLGSE